MPTPSPQTSTWRAQRIRTDEIDKYLNNGKTFIDEDQIDTLITTPQTPRKDEVQDILAKSRTVQTLQPQELATLMQVTDPELWDEMRQTAAEIKRNVYDNRIVTFAPLYLSNLCVNNCRYCGLRSENTAIERRTLSMDDIRRETEVLAGKIGHKRLIVVYGEHPSSDIHYMTESLRTIYDVKVKARKGYGQIRRVNVNAAPLPIDELKLLKESGIGTFQVFQETYHRKTYRHVHPKGTLKGDYEWRLYAMHRAFEAGIDDVGLGALFGLYDWRFELLSLLQHSLELEGRFGVGPHTISFPRLEPASNTPFAEDAGFHVSDENMEKLVVLIRLAVPHTGMILTARENAAMRRRLIPLGCTQTDASSRVGIGAYADFAKEKPTSEQFVLGDDRELDDVIRELAEMGYITSFCTAGYRCGRTGKCIMDMLRSGKEGRFCKLNAVITFREWLDDFASPETILAGEKVIQAEIQEIKDQMPSAYDAFLKYYEQTVSGGRDLYF